MSPLPSPDHLVRTQHRRRRYTLLVWTLALALIAAVLALAIHLAWLPPSLPVVIGHWSFVISSALALTTWFARARRLDENHVARDLDAEWQLKARVEAAAELAGDRSALAAAQRADAAQRLAGRRLPRALAWHTGQLTLILALLFLLVESTVFTIRIFDKPPPPPPPPEDISASIEWRAPESELKATAIEEIALAASADTRTGFRSMSLEISVNGEPRLSLPLDAATIKTLAKPGTHAVKLPLYLDETSAAEFDMVSYHLRADRKTRLPAPVVTSPLQFIQIRPAREEVQMRKSPPGQSKMDQLLALVGSLKAAQLALLKQNFLLAHAPISKTEKAWIDANATVAADQKTLAVKTAEARTFAIEVEAEAIVVDNLAQVIPLMETASAQIAETQNEPATRPQGRALALITEIEKIIQKVINLSSGGDGPPPPKNPDPFKDDQRYKLPPREKTPAGQLEQLAKDQSEQADKTDPSPSSGDKQSQPPSAAEQAELARRAEELAKNQKLGEAAQKAAAQAARDAAAAANQLKQGDASAARAPAQAAAQTLRDAAAAQEKAGRDAARAALEAARRALNEAAREPNAAARAEKIDAVARQLHEAALEQQQSGSAEAARQLEAAAREAAKAAEAARKGTDSGPQPGDKPGDKPGDNAGTQPGNVSPSDQPGDKPGTKPGDQTGTQPGDQPGQRPGGDKPGDQPGDKPGSSPGSQLTPDPKGEQELTINLPGAGQQPGEGSGKEPGKEPGQGSGPGEKPDPNGQGQGQQPDPKGQGQGQDEGQGEGKGSGQTPGTQPGSGGSGSQPGSGSGSGPGSAPRLTPVEKAAQTAATAQVALSDRIEAAGRAARQLQRGSGEGSGPGSGSGTGPGEGTSPGGASRPSTDIRTSELILGAQLAHAVVNTSESAHHANTIISTFRPTNKFAHVVMTPEVRAAVDHLRLLLAAAISDDKRDETVRRFNPEDLDPAYREAIESYFERLSREATPSR